MTERRGPIEVLIVGAGPTGLTLAVELARLGVPFRLIEAAPEPQRGSRGKGIQPRTLEVFDDLGIARRVIAHGRMAMPIRTTAADGRVTLAGGDTAGTRPGVPYPATLITPQWRIEEALRARLAEFGGAVEFGTALASFEPSADAVTAVVVSHGRNETVAARWLAGCDGGHSVVRHVAGIVFDGETREAVRMIVADVAVDGLDADAWHMWQHAEGLVSLCPLPSTDLYQYRAGIAPGQDPALTLANMQALLDRRTGRTDIRLREPAWSSLWRANVRLVDRYRAGRVLLAGDAAHIHSPAGGQGMNTGIQDAHNLGWKLAAVANGASPALLDTYEAERRPVAAGVLALSDARLHEAIEHKRFNTHADATTMQLGIGYRGSILARDDRDDSAVVRAGDRAADAAGLLTTHGERRLFDLTRGGHFTLLNFGPEIAAERLPASVAAFHVVPLPMGDGDVDDSRGELARAFAAGARTLATIRPDGYIAAISDAGDLSPIAANIEAMLP